MAFFIASSPHAHNKRSTSQIMLTVLLCALPGLAAQWYFFGWGVIIQLALAISTAWAAEAVVMRLRQRPPLAYLRDNSALLTAFLLAVAIPPLAPWWVIVIGTLFSIIVAKHIYGGLGQNLFNPAMVGYVVLLISFPVQMTTWLPPESLAAYPLTLGDALSAIFSGFTLDGFSVNQLRMTADGVTMATPLDTIKTALAGGKTVSEALQQPIFSAIAGEGWAWVNALYLVGGLVLIQRGIINWHIPVAMLSALLTCALIGHLIAPDQLASPLIHLLSGATMLGAFFIATDPVSASTTDKGRLWFGGIIGVLVFLIRTWGGYPDGVAFAVIIANLCVPLIDYYTKPRTYGHTHKRAEKKSQS
ncbi:MULTISPECIES: electron transport complex subunit RsxD [unclassified Salinivibrio]|uniref:electron transport complex subunit RsxD n=1 Tax=unclassified Salinivibrio TaxID=2636825 RepID=UPI0009857471|nr:MULTISPECIES: electron transport complex subunit RsxD [unclassified Salinivibrio]OOF15613.1 electron transport complex subunit RsxD [Salinivibrio sp. PR919]OOF19450.1 electron transport complex subunit RsxD [Salinivibrio sp. PR932]